MAPKLYMCEFSSDVRSVLLTSKAIGMELETVRVDMLAGEHLKPEYEKLNPTHMVPTLIDNGLILHEAHAISAYLVDKYAKNDALYPKDIQQRALVNQKLFHDGGTLCNKLKEIATPIMLGKSNSVSKELVDSTNEEYKVIETFLQDHSYIVGKELTIADLFILSTVSTMDILVPIENGEFPNISKWMSTMTGLPYYKENQDSLDHIANILKAKEAK